MGRTPNRSNNLTPAGERKRKSRGTDKVTKGARGPGLDIEPNPDWHPTAHQIWEAGLTSGGADFYEATDLAVLHLTCEGVDHWLQQGGRKSPELLRVLMQSLGSLLFTETDRRKLRIELEAADDQQEEILANVSNLFGD